MSDAAPRPSAPTTVAAPPSDLPAVLGGRASPPFVGRVPTAVAVTVLMRANARALRSKVPDGPAVDTGALSGLDALARRWEVVRTEWDAVRTRVAQLPTVDQLIDRDPGWDGRWEWYAVLGRYGWFPDARVAFPETIRLLGEVEGLVEASFSILPPGGFLRPHRGINTGVIRGLVGIDVPEPESCGMLVGDRRMDLVEGQCLAFDDTFEHAAWNRGTRDRVVLLLEITRRVGGVAGRINRLAQSAYRRHPYVEGGSRRFTSLLAAGGSGVDP